MLVVGPSRLPFGIAIGFLKYVILASHIHDTILEIKFPFVARACDLYKLNFLININ